jgi:predicted nucleotidyltransferase
MSDPITNTQPVSPSSTSTSSSESPSGSSATTSYSTQTELSSLGDLKEKAPQVYDATMMGIAQSMISQMKRSQERLKEIMREGRRQAGIQ